MVETQMDGWGDTPRVFSGVSPRIQTCVNAAPRGRTSSAHVHTYAMALAALLLGACAFEGPWARQLTHAHAAATVAATAAATQCVRQHGAEDAWHT